MSLCSQATEVLRQNPDRYMTAAEVVLAATGHTGGHAETRRMEHALLVLVESDIAFPRNHPSDARAFRIRGAEQLSVAA